MKHQTHEEIRTIVRKAYGAIANKEEPCCAPGSCGTKASPAVSPCEAEPAVLQSASSLGSGDPLSHADVQAGERVVDLGSGRGEDCLVAAELVGREGHVIGVDMTPEMVAKARATARALALDHVEFRQSQIETLPIDDQWADVVISNCVFNLSPEKHKVFLEALRVLRPGGRLVISDIIANERDGSLTFDANELVGCIAGAATIPELRGHLTNAGFVDIRISAEPLKSSTCVGDALLDKYSSALIQARRPD